MNTGLLSLSRAPRQIRILLSCVPIQKATAHAQGTVTAKRLSHFLPDAVELARRGEAVHHGLPTQQLQALRSAFFLHRRLSPKFDGAAAALPPQLQLELLERLGRAVDAAGAAAAAVRDAVLVIGDAPVDTGVDALGRVWLPHSGTVAVWAHALQRLDMPLVRRRQEQRRAAAAAERAAAAALGVRAVFAAEQRLSLSSLFSDALRVCASFRLVCVRPPRQKTNVQGNAGCSENTFVEVTV